MSISNSSLIKVHLKSVSATECMAARMAEIVKVGDLLLFTGEIGAGKTTFIKAFAKTLGITESVTSPTFVLHTLYESGSIVLSHVDLYRLDNDVDVESIGFEDYFDDAVTAIEWADRYSKFNPPYVHLKFDYGEREEERILTIQAKGGDWSTRISSLEND